MSALYGFSGPRDDKLLGIMGEALAHRGRGQVELCHAPGGSVAFRAGSRAGGPHGGVIAGRINGRIDDRIDDMNGGVDVILGIAGTVSLPTAPVAPIAISPPSVTHHDNDAGRSTDPVLARLLAAYLREGIDFVNTLQGAFVLAIIDGEILHLVRGGAGARTIFHGRHSGRMWFAIEPKGIWSVPGFPRRIRADAVAEYFTFSFCPGEGTMLEDVRELQCGHVLTVHVNGANGANGANEAGEQRRYFHFERIPDLVEPLEDAVWVRRCKDLLSSAIAERLALGGSAGAFLSGGIDSSVVVCELARQYASPLKTYAIHFGPKYPHELEFARQVAQCCKTDHEEVLITPKDFLPNLHRIIWHLDDPIGDPITVPNYELARHAAREIDVAFNGEGGDPCFGGPKNIPMMLHQWYGMPLGSATLERQYLASYRRAFEELPYLLTPEWGTLTALHAHLEGIIRPFFTASEPELFLDKLCALNIRLKGAHLILPKVERMLGAFEMTPASPLFDDRLVQLSFQIPPRLKLSRGVEKLILKNAYADQLPQSIIARPKSGMRVPVHFWFQGELKRYARKILHPRTVRRAGIFNPSRVKQLLDYNIEEGQGRYGIRLWMLLTFEIWRRVVIEGERI